MVKNLPEMQEMQVQSLGWEDTLEKGSGNPFQHSCPGNPMDRGAWGAIVHGVTKSRTWLSNSHYPLSKCWLKCYCLLEASPDCPTSSATPIICSPSTLYFSSYPNHNYNLFIYLYI